MTCAELLDIRELLWALLGEAARMLVQTPTPIFRDLQRYSGIVIYLWSTWTLKYRTPSLWEPSNRSVAVQCLSMSDILPHKCAQSKGKTKVCHTHNFRDYTPSSYLNAGAPRQAFSRLNLLRSLSCSCSRAAEGKRRHITVVHRASALVSWNPLADQQVPSYRKDIPVFAPTTYTPGLDFSFFQVCKKRIYSMPGLAQKAKGKDMSPYYIKHWINAKANIPY